MGTVAVNPDRIASLLFGRVRREVLSLVLGRPDERFYLREIVRVVGGGSGAVQRELAQLVDVGLVNRDSSGHQVYFSANRNSPIFGELRAIVEKTAGPADVLRRALGPLGRKGAIQIAFIYGSVASGKAGARSDIDLCVIGDVSLTALVPVLQTAERRLGREVNPSLYPVPEFRQKVARKNAFLTRLISGAKVFVTGDGDELGRLAR